MRRRSFIDRWAGPLFCVPALGLLLFAVVIPFFVAFAITFTDQRLLSPNPTRFVGLENYRRLLAIDLVEIPRVDLVPTGTSARETPSESGGEPQFERLRTVLKGEGYRGFRRLVSADVFERRFAIVARDPIFYRSIYNTLLFVFMVLPLQCGFALVLALIVNQKFPGRTVFRTLYFAPVVTSMVVVSIVWSFLFNADEGLVNAALHGITGGAFSGIDWLGDERFALLAVVIMSAWQGAGFQMLIFLAGLQSIDPILYEAAKMDGANVWQRFRHVTWPGLRNTTVFVVISTTIAAFGLFTQIDVMTRGGPNDSTSTLIFHAVRTGFREQDVAYGSAVAVVFFCMVLTVTLFQRALSDPEERKG
ncbi:MAG: sugar ABC transporter permease [Myxococcota bacterium]